MEGKEAMKYHSAVVPWSHKEEWEDVYQKLYSNNAAELKLALEKISCWSSRSHPILPLGIEVTAAIVQAKLEEMTNQLISQSDQKARVLYSMALIRFVNLVSELGQTGNSPSTVRGLALKVGIPEWMVDLRHEATHGYMPSVHMLRASMSVAMEWLRLNYWEKERTAMTEWRTGSGAPETSFDEDIKELITTFQQLRYEILHGNYSKGQKESKKAMESDILQNIEIVLRVHRITFIKQLVQPGFLIPMENHLEALLKPDEIEFQREETTFLPSSLEKFWVPVLKLLEGSRNLQVLLESLLTVDDPLSHRFAVAWVERILDIVTSDGSVPEVYTYPLASVFRQDYTLDWLLLLKAGLKSPNKYSTKVLTNLAHEVHRTFSGHVGHSLMALVAIYLGTTVEEKQSIGGHSQRIFTLKDISTVRNGITKVIRNNRKTSWKQCVDHIEWNKYPLGTAPDSDLPSFYSSNLPIENDSSDGLASDSHICRRNSAEEEDDSENEVCELESDDRMVFEEEPAELPKLLQFNSISVF